MLERMQLTLTCELLSDKLTDSDLQLPTRAQSFIKNHQEKNPPEPVRPEHRARCCAETQALRAAYTASSRRTWVRH